MEPRIAIKRIWSDEDLLKLSVQVCDGRSLFVSEAYVALNWGTASGNSLKTLGPQVPGGIFDLEAGNDGPEFASGAFRARFHWFRPTALLLSTTQQGDFFEFKKNQVAPEAKMFLRTEPGLLDRFAAALPSLDRADVEEAVLECVSAEPA